MEDGTATAAGSSATAAAPTTTFSTASPDTPSTPTEGPHVQRACNICRQRRVQCDRKLPSCSNCLRSEVRCIYPPGRGRAPKRPRHTVAPQLSARLSRLESIINQLCELRVFLTKHLRGGDLGTDLSQAREHQPDSSLAQESGDAESLDRDFGRLKVDETKSYYVNNELWVTLSNEVDELRDLLFEPASEGGGDYEITPSPYRSTAHSPSSSATMTRTTTARMTGDSPASAQSGLNASILGYRAIASSLRQLHPSLPQAVALFAAFSDNILPLVRIFHMPTLTRVYWDALASLETLDKNTETLLFAMHYSAVISLTPEQCLDMLGEPREAVLEHYRFAVEQALARGDLLNTKSMTMLQAAVLFLSALPNEDDSRAVWSLTSLIHHIARTMGLHRDGSAFGLPPFATELRRRLWWQICIIDSRSSEHHCNEPITARGYFSDTKVPLHIDDADLTPDDMAQPPAERWDRATDMTLSLVRCEAIQTGWKLGRLSQSSSGGGGVSSAAACQAVIRDLEKSMREKYLPICDPSVPFQLLASAVARIILARYWLTTHYSAASSGDGAAGATTSGPRDDHLFQTSVSILELSGMLLARTDMLQWAWYSKTHIQWGAMAFVLCELCARPPSPACDHAWACVTTVYDGWNVRGSPSESPDDRGRPGRLALWRPIRRLMAKVRYVRELQQTEPAAQQQHRSNDTLPQQQPQSQQQQQQQPLPPLTSSLLPPSVHGSYESADVLYSVLGIEDLGPFINLLPDWPWLDMDADTIMLAGMDSGLLPGL